MILNNDLLQLIVSFQQNGKRWYDIHDGDWVSEYGHITILKEKSIVLTFTKYAMDLAATYGHLDIVKWLHENRKEGCTVHAMDASAQHGDLPMLVWLHENRREGCTVKATQNAQKNGHEDVVEWLQEHRPECYKTVLEHS